MAYPFPFSFWKSGADLLHLIRIGPFQGKAPVAIAGLSNLTVSSNTLVNSTFNSPTKFNSVTVNSAIQYGANSTTEGFFLWCETLTLSGGNCRIRAEGVDAQSGSNPGITGDGGLGSSGGGSGSAFEAESGRGGTVGNDGIGVDFNGGFGTGAGGAGSYMSDMAAYLSLIGSGGSGGDGGISLSTGAYTSGAGGSGGSGFSGGGGGGSEDLINQGASGGGGGGGGRPIIIICRTLNITADSNIYAPGGLGGEGLTTFPLTGGGGGGGGGMIYIASKKKTGTLLSAIVSGGDGGGGGLLSDGVGKSGTDGSVKIFEINHAETTLTLRSLSDVWDNS